MTTPYPLNYTVTRGEVWERLIIPKDKRTRRRRIPVQAAATVQVGLVKYVLPTTITSEGGVLISLSEANTNWFTAGAYPWDMVVTVSRSNMFTQFPQAQELLVKGTLTVVDLPHLTPLASDGTSSALAVLV